jgi:predicted nucleic acid-binding protein
MYLRRDIIEFILKPSEKFQPTIEKILSLKEKLFTSAISIVVLELEKKKLEKDYKQLSKKIEILPIDKKLLEDSFKIKNKYNISIFDSIEIASCMRIKDKFLTFDIKSFENIKEVKIVNPSELFSEEKKDVRSIF